MSHLEVNREQVREGLCKIDEFEVGEVCIDTACGDTLLIVGSDGIITDTVEDFILEHDTQSVMPPFDRLEDITLAVCLESGELVTYKKPYRKEMKRPKSARLYVKEG